LNNILKPLQEELGLLPQHISFNTTQDSDINFEMSAMNFNGRRPSGCSPTNKKLHGGGVALPLTPNGNL